MSEELKPCPNPWCADKGRPYPHHTVGFALWSIRCGRCGLQGPSENTKAEAIAVWNRRPQPAVSGDVVETDLANECRERATYLAAMDAGCLSEIERQCMETLTKAAEKIDFLELHIRSIWVNALRGQNITPFCEGASKGVPAHRVAATPRPSVEVVKPFSQLAELLKQRRSGMGLRNAAKEIGISPATLSRMERGNLPEPTTLDKLCDWLGVKPVLQPLSQPSTDPVREGMLEVLQWAANFIEQTELYRIGHPGAESIVANARTAIARAKEQSS